MKDKLDGGRILVSTHGTAGPYILVGIDQLNEVKTVLEKEKVQCWASPDAISANGKPWVGVVNVGVDNNREDVSRIQGILDRCP